MNDVSAPGGFRVLWVSDPALLPADGKVLSEKGLSSIGFALTRDGPGDARALWAAPEHEADKTLAGALVAARAGDTQRLGHLLGPTGVRYVVVVNQAGPGHGAVVPLDTAMSDAIARQLDLSISRIDTGAIVYSNDAWLPRRAVVPPGTAVAATGDPLVSAASSDAGAVASGVVGPVGGSHSVGPGTVLWSEAADSGWHASAGGGQLSRSDAFGWTNAFALPAHESVGIHFDAGLVVGLFIWFEIVAWIVAITAWRLSRTRRLRTRTRGGAA